jgi:hypothetical protein
MDDEFTLTAVVDRIEDNGMAVLEVSRPDGHIELVDFPVSLLPPDVTDGDEFEWPIKRKARR